MAWPGLEGVQCILHPVYPAAVFRFWSVYSTTSITCLAFIILTCTERNQHPCASHGNRERPYSSLSAPLRAHWLRPLATAWAVTPAPTSPPACKASLRVISHGELNMTYCALLHLYLITPYCTLLLLIESSCTYLISPFCSLLRLCLILRLYLHCTYMCSGHGEPPAALAITMTQIPFAQGRQGNVEARTWPSNDFYPAYVHMQTRLPGSVTGLSIDAGGMGLILSFFGATRLSALHLYQPWLCPCRIWPVSCRCPCLAQQHPRRRGGLLVRARGTTGQLQTDFLCSKSRLI